MKLVGRITYEQELAKKIGYVNSHPDLSEKVSKSEVARRLGVSRASLYYKPKKPIADEALRQAIEVVMLKHHGYGHRRVADALGINRKRALRVMKLYNLKPARRCKTPTKPGDAGKEALNFPDITRIFSPIAPHVLWVSDFTFINFHGRFVFFATVIDRFTTQVLGANVMLRHTTELIEGAFNQALATADCTPQCFHSDQGSEYGSDRFLALLSTLSVQISMCPKASPWRNPQQESFFGRFKVEFGDPDRFETLAELIEAIYAYVAYYNNDRIHTRLRMSPVEFRNLWHQRQELLLQRGPHLTYTGRSRFGPMSSTHHEPATHDPFETNLLQQ